MVPRSGALTLMAVAKPAARGQFLLVLLAFCCLGYAFADKDFSVLYVAATSNSQLPLHYRLAAIWGAHEGSLLLWMFILSYLDGRRLSSSPPICRRRCVRAFSA